MAESLKLSEGWFDNRKAVYRTIIECYLAPEILLGIIQGKYEADPAVFPEDVKLVDAVWDDRSVSFKLTLSSESFPLTAEGSIPYAMSIRPRYKDET